MACDMEAMGKVVKHLCTNYEAEIEALKAENKRLKERPAFQPQVEDDGEGGWTVTYFINDFDCETREEVEKFLVKEGCYLGGWYRGAGQPFAHSFSIWNVDGYWVARQSGGLDI